MEHRSVEFNENAIKAALSGLPLSGLRVFRSIGSTNDEGLAWALAGAADLSLVVADEQTAGRGRRGRKWLTPPGTALALSMILRGEIAQTAMGRLAGLGAMAIGDACAELGLEALIKWPNDVLLGGRKVGGVLVEAQWSGDHMEACVLGVGVNVLAGSSPAAGTVRFPATSIEEALGRVPNRLDVLRATVSAIVAWRSKLRSQQFTQAWESRLAFRGHQVTLTRDGEPPLSGRLLGLQEDGSLELVGQAGVFTVQMGEIHLQPTDDRMPQEPP